MNDITQGMKFTIDVKSGLVEMPQRAVLMKGDKNANRVSMVLYDGEKAVSLEGATVTGTYVLAGVKIPLTGEASGNEATILLPDECYSASGRYELRMHVTMGGVKRTFLFITGYVESDGEGATLDVEGVIPNLDDIVAQYDEMKRVTAETEEARDQALEAAKSANFQVLDRFDTYAQLVALHPTGKAGEAYAVGTESNNAVYIWGVDTLAWVNIGAVQGAQGPAGPIGPQGPTGKNGVGASARVTAIAGGHRVTITSESGTVSFDVMDGEDANVELDATLTKSGQAADAKATGDKIKTIEGAVEKVLPYVTNADAGKFLRVSSAGAWAAESVAYAEGANF